MGLEGFSYSGTLGESVFLPWLLADYPHQLARKSNLCFQCHVSSGAPVSL